MTNSTPTLKTLKDAMDVEPPTVLLLGSYAAIGFVAIGAMWAVGDSFSMDSPWKSIVGIIVVVLIAVVCMFGLTSLLAKEYRIEALESFAKTTSNDQERFEARAMLIALKG